jgi:hypothetical protein
MDLLSYYTQQSPITDPKAYAGLLAGLPRDLAGLCRVVQSLLFHYFADEKILHYSIPKERLPEVDTRDVATMLARIVELDNRPLVEPHPPDRRLVGCCREFATLLCAMARHQGIPARVRVGFSTYFIPQFHVDHEIMEYWDAGARRWRLVDPELSERHIKAYRVQFDPLDVPRDAFIVGGRAWQMCRADEASAERFGLAPDSDLKGWWFIRSRLLHDMAAQNKMDCCSGMPGA